GTYLAGYLSSKNSDAFAQAQLYLMESSIAQSKLGQIREVELSPFGYELEFSGSSGSADFKCKIEGATGNGEAYVKLTKTLGKWKVKEAKLLVYGQEIPLVP